MQVKIERNGNIIPLKWDLWLYGIMIEALKSQGYTSPMSEFSMSFKKGIDIESTDGNVLHILKGDILTH